MKRGLTIPFLLGLSLALASAIGSPQPTSRPTTQPTTQPADRIRENVVAWLTIGGSSDDQSRRQVGWRIDQFGWSGFVQHVADPVVRQMRAAGYKPRLVVHNPFGTIAGEPMQFDQRLHASEGVEGVHPPLVWLCKGFEEAWSKYLRDNPDVEAICYLGTLNEDRDFAALARPGQTDDWLWRFWASLRPALDAGMDIGWDASAIAPADSPTWAAMQLVRNLGTTVYVESRPSQPHMAGWPVISIYEHFGRSDPERFPDAANMGHLRNDQLGPTMVLVVGGTEESRKTRARAVLSGGLNLSIQPHDLGWALPMAKEPARPADPGP